MTDSTIPIPRFVYKIVPSQPPSPLPYSLPLSALDAQDGFIHLSDASQVAKTADLFFADFEKVWLLQLDTEVVKIEGGKLCVGREPTRVCAFVREGERYMGWRQTG